MEQEGSKNRERTERESTEWWQMLRECESIRSNQQYQEESTIGSWGSETAQSGRLCFEAGAVSNLKNMLRRSDWWETGEMLSLVPGNSVRFQMRVSNSQTKWAGKLRKDGQMKFLNVQVCAKYIRSEGYSFKHKWHGDSDNRKRE